MRAYIGDGSRGEKLGSIESHEGRMTFGSPSNNTVGGEGGGDDAICQAGCVCVYVCVYLLSHAG